MRISDWSSDVCSSDLNSAQRNGTQGNGASSAVPHGPDPDWIVTGQFSNDLFGGDDANFTHGTRFSALSPDGQVPQFIERAAKWLPLFPDDGSLRITYSLGQEIFTPERIEERELIEDDRPYAGWTYAGIGLVSERSEEHTSELQSLMRISYAVFCLQKKIP